MRTKAIGCILVMLILTLGWTQSDRSVRVAFLPYGDCKTCARITLLADERSGINLFAVSPDGTRFYLRDAEGTLHILSREGYHLKAVKNLPVSTHSIRAISADGSLVAFSSVSLIRLEQPEAVKLAEGSREIGKARETQQSQQEKAPGEAFERALWILKPNGTIDWERTDGFARAISKLEADIKREYDEIFSFIDEVDFFTGDRLGLRIAPPVYKSESGEKAIKCPIGLVVLKRDGSWEGVYPAAAVSKRGAILEYPQLRSLEAQLEVLQLTPNKVEFRILGEDGMEHRGMSAPFPSEPYLARFIHPDGKHSQEFMLRMDEMVNRLGVFLSTDTSARLDGQGRLYLLGHLPEMRDYTIRVVGYDYPIVVTAGYQIVRFKADGQYDRVMAQLKIPTEWGSPDRYWDVDDSGNLYYLQFTSEGVEIRKVPSK